MDFECSIGVNKRKILDLDLILTLDLDMSFSSQFDKLDFWVKNY